MKNYVLNDQQKAIITALGHPLYTAEFVEGWLNRDDNVFTNAPAALQAMGAKGFFDAVAAMERAGVTASMFADVEG